MISGTCCAQTLCICGIWMCLPSHGSGSPYDHHQQGCQWCGDRASKRLNKITVWTAEARVKPRSSALKLVFSNYSKYILKKIKQQKRTCYKVSL